MDLKINVIMKGHSLIRYKYPKMLQGIITVRIKFLIWYRRILIDKIRLLLIIAKQIET